MYQDTVSEFPYKHSTGATIGRFLAGLKEQKRIWGQRVSGQGVVVPPVGYSEHDGSAGGEWVEVKPTGVITAIARVFEPIDHLHPSDKPFAFVLVQLEAPTPMLRIVAQRPRQAVIGARVERSGKTMPASARFATSTASASRPECHTLEGSMMSEPPAEPVKYVEATSTCPTTTLPATAERATCAP
jgi:uncharacterized OB-fold protein